MRNIKVYGGYSLSFQGDALPTIRISTNCGEFHLSIVVNHIISTRIAPMAVSGIQCSCGNVYPKSVVVYGTEVGTNIYVFEGITVEELEFLVKRRKNNEDI